MKKWVLLRRISQVFFTILFIYILWPATYPLKGLLSAEIFFKIDPLVMVFTSICRKVILPGMVFSLAMLAFTLVFGRFFCGWACPLGTAIDLAGCLRKKNTSEKDAANKFIRLPKFYILAAIALFALLGFQLAWVFDPIAIMARFISLNLIPSAVFLTEGSFGINARYFSHSGIIFAYFLAVCCLALIKKRLWCRCLCPLGAFYSLFAKGALMRRTVERCADCGICKSQCRMGAIKDDSGYVKGECILCMDCLYDCPEETTKFVWSAAAPSAVKKESGDISRRNFMYLLLSSLVMLGFSDKIKLARPKRSVIRPPASLDEDAFLDRCIRCGNCMKVCITNGLQPVMLQSGPEGIWTPQLVPEIGYCEYNCTLCGNTCPTGAIRRLTLDRKHDTRLGLAVIDRGTCIAWAQNRQCIVCREHCPIPGKAIKIIQDKVGAVTVLKPVVDKTLCVGCGICQNKCPVRPVRAIRVSPF